jgi:uncharacterized membrane protein
MDARFTPEGDTGEGLRVIVRPNRTLTLRGMTMLFAGLTVVVLTIGIGFTLAGAWPVLPFAGLELAVVGAVLCRLFRHADDHDRIMVDRERVTVIRRRGRREWRDEFQRYWTKVVLERRRGWYPPQLKVGSHGRFVVIAADVNEKERESLAITLNDLLRKQAEGSTAERE